MTDDHLDIMNALKRIAIDDKEAYLFMSQSPDEDVYFYDVCSNSSKLLELIYDLSIENKDFKNTILNASLNILEDADLNTLLDFNNHLIKINHEKNKELGIE